MTRRAFPPDTLAALRHDGILRIRAGSGRHRFIGIWVVVVGRRVFVRSWSLHADGWWRTLVAERGGTIRVARHGIAVRAVRTRAERLKRAVDRAYLAKYGRGGSRRYALDLARAECRATTTELVPR